MTFATLADQQLVTDARLGAGKAAWAALQAIGGLWPPCDIDPPPAGIWDGMGEYQAETVQAIIRDALPKAPAANAWPWIARAIFIYENETGLAAWHFPAEANADALARTIGKQATALSKNLTDLAWLSGRSDGEVGSENSSRALEVSEAIRATQSVNAAGGTFSVGKALRDIAKACAQSRGSATTDRRRGASDRHLALLVAELGDFWESATGHPPSASDPARKDGKPSPFVRLVNGCLSLAGAAPASPWQVDTAIKRAGGIAPKEK